MSCSASRLSLLKDGLNSAVLFVARQLVFDHLKIATWAVFHASLMMEASISLAMAFLVEPACYVVHSHVPQP